MIPVQDVYNHRIRVGSGLHGVSVWPQPGRASLGHTSNIR
jgi:hypothetical protein